MSVSTKFWPQTSHFPQQNEAAELDWSKVDFFLGTFVSYVVVGVFFITKMKFQVVRKKRKRFTAGYRR